MNQERKNRINELRAKLSNLSDNDRQKLTARGIIATIEGRQLSINNTLLLYLQSNGTTPSIVGGYNQWKRAGRQVKRGEHGFMIWFPVGTKDEESGDILSADTFYTATVFDITQTMVIGESPEPEQPEPVIIPAQRQPEPELEPQPVNNNDYMKGWTLV